MAKAVIEDGAIRFLVKTQTAYDGTFTAIALTHDNARGRITARDSANGFPNRAQARKWAENARAAQMRARSQHKREIQHDD